MDSFRIEGKNGYIQISILEVFGFPDEISYFGGYEAKGMLEVKSNSYNANGELWFSTGEIYTFFTTLKKCYEDLNGDAELLTTERNLKMTLHFGKMGHVLITGEYIERYDINNKLVFEIVSDQSYLGLTINELNEITKQYGGMKGIKEDI